MISLSVKNNSSSAMSKDVKQNSLKAGKCRSRSLFLPVKPVVEVEKQIEWIQLEQE